MTPKLVKSIEPFVALARKCNDCYLGEFKLNDKKYIPLMKNETDAQYKKRVLSSEFSNFISPLVDTIPSLILKKEIKITGADSLDLENVDLQGNSLSAFMHKATKSSILGGVSFIAINTNETQSYLQLFDYQDLLSFRVEDKKLSQVVFKEEFTAYTGDFGEEKQERVTVYTNEGGYTWYAKDGGKEQKQEEWQNSLGEVAIVPIITGKEIDYLKTIPLINDIVNLNIVAINRDSEIVKLMTILTNPVPVIYGEISNQDLEVGISKALLFNDKQASGFEYVTVPSSPIQELGDKNKELEAKIDKLSLSLLTSNNSTTVIDARQNEMKSSSYLSAITIELESKIQNILNIMLSLEGKTANAVVEMSHDFAVEQVNIELAYKMLTSGDMSRETFYSVLATGKLPKDFNIKEELTRIGDIV